MALNIYEQFCTKNDCYKEQVYTTSIQYLIVHAPAVIKASWPKVEKDAIVSANEWYKRWNKPGLSKLTHGFVDHDGVHLFAPTLVKHPMRCWHCANGNTHMISIGLEFCEYNDEYLAKKVYQNGVEFYAMLAERFNVPVERILGHYEAGKKGIASEHSDPELYFWNKCGHKTMNDFRNDVKKILNRKKEKDLADYNRDKHVVKSFYEIKSDMFRYVGVDKLDIHTAPDNNSPIHPNWPFLSKNDMVFVIVKMSNNWALVEIANKEIGWVDASKLYMR